MGQVIDVLSIKVLQGLSRRSKLCLRQMGLKLLTFQGTCGCRTAFNTGDLSQQIYFLV